MTTQPPERPDAPPADPQSPPPPGGAGGPQSPAGPQSPSAPQSPASPGAPQSPAAPPSPTAPESPASPGYSGPMPPGGWQQPVARAGGPPAGTALSGWGSRVGATLLDALVLTLVLVVLIAPGVVLTAVSGGEALGIILIVVAVLAYIVVALLYAPFFMQRDGRRNGQTLGKQWLGIRVVRMDGQPFAWGTSLLRELVVKNLLFGTVGGFFAGIPTLLDLLWPLWDDENRALHDMLVSTHVVRA